MERKLTPLDIFQSEGLADSFLPVDFNNKNVLFWRVPELLEKNIENKRTADITGIDLRADRRKANLNYIKESMQGYVNKKIKDKPEYSILEDNLNYLFENSGVGRIGSHLAGLYIDYSKIPELFELPPKEAKRIVDNNLVLANVACIYSAFVENKVDKSKYQNLKSYEEANQRCEDAKTLFNSTLNLISEKNVHLIPVFCVATVTVEGDKEVVERGYFGDDGKKLELEANQEKVTLQKDLMKQFDEIRNKDRTRLSAYDMFLIQQTCINNVKNELKKQNKQEQASKHKPINPTFGD